MDIVRHSRFGDSADECDYIIKLSRLEFIDLYTLLKESSVMDSDPVKEFTRKCFMVRLAESMRLRLLRMLDVFSISL